MLEPLFTYREININLCVACARALLYPNMKAAAIRTALKMSITIILRDCFDLEAASWHTIHKDVVITRFAAGNVKAQLPRNHRY